MQFAKRILRELNFAEHCSKYGISLWQCPQFLFLVMGIVIIGTNIATFYIGTRLADEPGIAALIVMAITAILFVIGQAVISGFERIAEASRMKSELVSVVSHQLRGPLSSIQWAVEFLLSGKAGQFEQKQQTYLQNLMNDSKRMMETVTNILKTSQIEQGALPVSAQEFSLEDVLKRMVSKFYSYANGTNVEFSLEISPNFPAAMGDPQKVEFVIENLIDNAIRYIRKDGSVIVRAKKENRHVYVEIIDNGIGIPPQDQRFIFQKFFRSKNALRYQTEGTGLGLYICKSFIEKMKGKIGFYSQENKGSTFWFTLPIAKSNQ